jgi:hypothetical protein
MPATQRQRLPDRRLNQTFTFVGADGLRYTATAAWFDDGRLGELFLGNHKPNGRASGVLGAALDHIVSRR